MWPNTRLIDLLGIRHPLIQAPMLGSATPKLAAAVTSAGGLGSLGCGTVDLATLRSIGEEIRALTNGPFNLNFFVLPQGPTDPVPVEPAVAARIAPYFEQFDLGPVPQTLPMPSAPFDDAAVEVLESLRPRVISFHFGVPSDDKIARLKSAGIVLIASATCVDEARALEAAGMDAIIAQGWEAGGHRGSFRPTAPGDGVGTMALVPQVVDSVRVPVIAAGGIGDARGIAAAFMLGASGVQMGTAFLSCPEAATDARRRAVLAAATDRDTMVTQAVSGRSARALHSRWADDLADLGDALPPFPAMYALSGPVLAKAAEQNRDDEVGFHLYGQAAALNRTLPAADLTELLAVGAQELLTATAR